MLRRGVVVAASLGLVPLAVAAPGRPVLDARHNVEEQDWSAWASTTDTNSVSAWNSWGYQTASYTSSSQQSVSSTSPSYTSIASTTSTIVSTPNPTPSPTTTTKSITYPAPTAPCGTVSSLSAAFVKASPLAVPTVPAQLAFECLNSIPFNQSAALQYLDSIDPYLNWQTTFEYLADPPAEYAEKVQPPYDFYATWNAIKANTSAGLYQSEYEFGWAVYRATQLAHDGHFVLYTDSVTGIFSFGRPFVLVSVSLDGVTAPQPYLYSDIVQASTGTFTPSPITQIDGQDAISYLLVWSEYGSLQDPDALWNNLFWEPAQVALGAAGTGTGTFSGGGRGKWPYPGPSTTLTFANGSSVTRENFARVLNFFSNVTNGEDAYKAFLVPEPDAYQNVFEYAYSSLSSASSVSSKSAASTRTANATATSTRSLTISIPSTTIPTPGYPTPFVQEETDQNAGYFIDEPGYEDVAVLVVRSFISALDDEIPFQSVNTYFIETAAAMGKTKLIIDVSANGGGTILQGYDLFKQLFPSMLPYGASRYRAHEALNLMGEQSSYLAGLAPRSLDDNTTFQDIESSYFNYRTDVDVDYQNFDSWADKYSPVALGPEPDNFTAIVRWNMSDVLTPLNSGGIDISGYLNRTNITTQPFAPENIIIVTDGYCASTCTIFAELMMQQGGVKTVALGGRPQPGIIQAIGGVKGTNDDPFDYLFESIAEVFGASNASLQSYWETTLLSQYTALPLYRSTASVINARNGYLPGDDTPLQFVYQPADCRILYTPAMILDETAVWKTVADSVWGGGAGDACVAGGFNTTSAKLARREDTEEKRRLHLARKDIEYDALLDSVGALAKKSRLGNGESVMR